VTARSIELLPDMALFVAVASARNLSRAARALAMPVSSLSRRMTALEARVGVQLLRRSTRAIELTEAGAEYAARCRAIVEAAEVAHDQLRGHQLTPRGTLRVSTTPDLADVFLSPLFAEFARRYPELSFEFDLSPRAIDLVAEGFDVAVRVGALRDSSLTARKLGSLTSRLYAAPSYIARMGQPADPDDLARHECVRLARNGEAVDVWRLTREGRSVEAPIGGRFVANNMRLQLRLATLGMGVAAVDVTLARDDLAAGRIVPVLDGWSLAPVPVYALTSSKLVPARTRLFLDCLADHLRGVSAPAP
jgi:DNA-binding transcriptional LysR family regulator